MEANAALTTFEASRSDAQAPVAARGVSQGGGASRRGSEAPERDRAVRRRSRGARVATVGVRPAFAGRVGLSAFLAGA